MAVINYVFVDLETRKLSTDFTNGWGHEVETIPGYATDSNVPRMEFGYAATFDNHQCKIWTNPTELLEYLLLDQTHRIVTYNGERFDFNVLLAAVDAPTYQGDSPVFSDTYKQVLEVLCAKSVDLAKYVKQSAGHRVSLDSLLGAMFGRTKQLQGTDAWQLFSSGDLEAIVLATNYCIDDIYQLYKIHGIARELGQLAFTDNAGQMKLIEVRLPEVQLEGQPF